MSDFIYYPTVELMRRANEEFDCIMSLPSFKSCLPIYFSNIPSTN